MIVTNPKRNSKQLIGTYIVPDESVYFVYGDNRKTTIQSTFGLWEVEDDISGYNTATERVNARKVLFGENNILLNQVEFYVNKDYFVLAHAPLDNSNRLAISYTGEVDKAIFKATHTLSGVVLYENVGFRDNDFDNPDWLPESTDVVKSIITGYMGEISIEVKTLTGESIEESEFTQFLAGGENAIMLFDWGVVYSKFGVGSVVPTLSLSTYQIEQTTPGRTFVYNPMKCLNDISLKFIETNTTRLFYR